MIDQHPSIAAAAQVRQHVQRRDVADARVSSSASLVAII